MNYSTFKLKATAPCNLSDFAIDMAMDEEIDLIEFGFEPSHIASSDELFDLLDNGTLVMILEPTDLRIKRYVRPGMPIKTTDFTLLDIEPEQWIFSRGARKERTYKGTNGEVVVKDIYTYTYTDEGRTVDGYTRHIQWICEDGTIGSIRDTSGVINKKRLKQLNRDLRQGRLDYLEASAEELRDLAEMVPEPYKTQYNSVADAIDLLFSHYSVAVVDYISRGTLGFETAVLNETNPQILYIHSIPTAPPSPGYPLGLTVKTSILYQIRGWIETPGDTPGN